MGYLLVYHRIYISSKHLISIQREKYQLTYMDCNKIEYPAILELRTMAMERIGKQLERHRRNLKMLSKNTTNLDSEIIQIKKHSAGNDKILRISFITASVLLAVATLFLIFQLV